MILADGKHIQGIFIYDSSAKYEKGDFVVDDDCFYICTSGEPVQSDLRPSENLDHFAPYPGNKITSLEEYNSYVASPEGKEDKYVSSSVLHAVLQQGYYGFGDTGMIEAYISEKIIPINGEEQYVVDTNVYGLKDRLVDNTNLLDIVISQEELNNAYITVDRKLPELVNFLPSIPQGESEYCCILRQYTYVDIDDMGEIDQERDVYINHRHRVQELMDFQTGTIYYRTTVGTRVNGSSTWLYTGEISNWRSLVISTDLLKKMNDIISYYNEDNIRARLAEASNSGTTNSAGNSYKFNYRELLGINFTGSDVRNLVKEDSSIPSSLNGIIVPGITGNRTFENTDLLLTVNVKIPVTVGGKLFKSYTALINTKEVTTIIGSQQIDYYYLDDNALLVVKYLTDTEGGQNEKYIQLSVTESDRNTSYRGANINSIYFRDTRNE